MSNTTIGTCGTCGGAVCLPKAWLGINPPKPQCTSCGATPKEAHGPVIEMEPPYRKTKDMAYWLDKSDSTGI